jgi:anti-anti-sigma factor
VDYEIRDTGSVRELTLRGRLTFEGNGRFRKIIDGLGGQPHRPLTVDVSQLDFIDSAGLGMLLLLKEAVGGRATLQGPQGQVKRLLAASGFHTLMPIAG